MKRKSWQKEYADRYPELSRFANERQLDFKENPMSELDGDNDIIAAGTYLKINGNFINSLIPVAIWADQLRDLYSRAEFIRTDDADILALKVIYGAAGNDLHLIFQPICLRLVAEGNDAHQVRQGIFNTYGEDVYRKLNERGFTEIKDPSPYQTYYQDKMEIFDKKGSPFRKYAPGIDTECAIITFQEIFALLRANSSSDLRIYNCIRRKYNDSQLTFRHSLLFASENGGPDYVGQDFENKYANLIHLCPPNCQGLILALES